MAGDQLVKIELRNTFKNITTSRSNSGTVFVARLLAADLIEKYRITQDRMGSAMDAFINALNQVDDRYFSWWIVEKAVFDEKNLINTSEKDVVSCFSEVPTMDEFTNCNNYVARVQATIRQIKE